MTEPLFDLPPPPVADAPPAAPPAAPAGQRAPGRSTRRPSPQASLFSAELAEPRPADLAGVLAGAGEVMRLGGTARVAVVVSDEWRAAALLAAFDERGLSGSRVPTVEGNIGVRTAFCSALSGLAGAWLAGTVKRPPPDFRAAGLALRLWALAGGRRDSTGYLLALPSQDDAWPALRGALRAAGFPSELLTGGPALRITGRAHLVSLLDVLGPPPPAAPSAAWP